MKPYHNKHVFIFDIASNTYGDSRCGNPLGNLSNVSDYKS